MLRKSVIAAATGIVILLGASAAQALPITFHFTGVIDDVIDPGGVWDGRLQSGGLFRGSYTFDSETPPRVVDPGSALYDLVSVTALAGSETISTVGTEAHPYISIEDRSFDAYGLSSSIYDYGRFERVMIGLRLNDPTGQTFSDTSLPQAPPDLDLFSEHSFLLTGSDQSFQGLTVRGTLVSLVPEPGALAFVVLGARIMCRHKAKRIHVGTVAYASSSGRVTSESEGVMTC